MCINLKTQTKAQKMYAVLVEAISQGETQMLDQSISFSRVHLYLPRTLPDCNRHLVTVAAHTSRRGQVADTHTHTTSNKHVTSIVVRSGSPPPPCVVITQQLSEPLEIHLKNNLATLHPPYLCHWTPVVQQCPVLVNTPGSTASRCGGAGILRDVGVR